MILVGRKIINKFGLSHPQNRKPLATWEKIIANTDYNDFNQLRETFPSADYVPKYTIFNIAGNKYRLISEIDYPSGVVNVKQIWTHAEYSMKKYQDAIRGNKL